MNKLLTEAKRRTARDTWMGELKFWLIMIGGSCVMLGLCILLAIATASPS